MKLSLNKKVLPICILLCFVLLAGCEKKDLIDYSVSDNWAVCETDKETDADVFFICPTAVGQEDSGMNMVITNQSSRDSFLAATLMEKGIFDDNARFFAPYYRQATLEVYSIPEEERGAYLDYSYEDVKTAFEYYLNNYNNERPIILAGFSQGGEMVKRIMFDYGNDSEVMDKLVASYMIGWNITDEELIRYPYVQMAEGEADTGVLVSFCSESEDITSSLIVPGKTHGINPLNWKTDDTLAEKSLNLGACFMDGTGTIYSEIPELTGAYIDSERGTLKVTDIEKEEYPARLSFLDEGNYHIYDYMFFYRNLEKNVQTRIEQYLTLETIKDAHFNRSANPKFMDYIEKYEAEDIEGMYLAPKVSAGMCEASFWIKDRADADKVIMDAEGIREFNESLLPKENNPGTFQYYIGDDRATSLGKYELTELVGVFKLPRENLYYTDGREVDDAFWQKILALRAMENIPARSPVRYGIVLESADIRVAPTNTALSAGEEYDYCDELQNSSVRMNEPVVVVWTSSDRNWYFVVTPFCSGWIDARQVGLTANYNYWREVSNPEDFLIVTENHSKLDDDPSNYKIAGREIDMGTKLELITDGSFDKNNYDRHAFNNYLIKLPCRDNLGKLYYENAYLPQNLKVNAGYLDYTQRNLVELAFNSLGEQYGWGGQYKNRDCSQYMKEIYKCFGIELPRNTKAMMQIPWTSLNVTDMSASRKGEILDTLPAGALLLFPGHVMMYLGEYDGEYYCISATGSMKTDVNGDLVRARSVLVNSLCSTWRGSGRTWMNSVTAIKVPFR